MKVAHRSKSEHFQYCQRRGYWAYLYQSRGISRKGFDPEPLVGNAVHKGVESALAGMTEDEAAAEAIAYFSRALNDQGLAPMVVETALGFETVDINTTQKTFMVNMVEALTRGYVRVRIPHLLDEFRLIEIEREEKVQLASDVTFLSRSDFIAERKLDGEYFIFNLKTVKWPDGVWRKKFHYDQQTLSELLGPEERHKRRFGGVIIEGLVKGTRSIEWPKGSKQRFNSSPLVWAWVGPDNDPFPTDIKAKYEYVDETGKNRRLGPSYTRVPAYNVMPIREWIDKLEREEPALLEAQFVTLPPVTRSEAEIESWKTSTIYQEHELELKQKVLAIADIPAFNIRLDQQFPKSTANGNCLGFGDSTCPFFKICWEGASPDDPDLFTPRTYNHPVEEELTK